MKLLNSITILALIVIGTLKLSATEITPPPAVPTITESSDVNSSEELPEPPEFPDLNTTVSDDGNDTVIPDDGNDTVIPDDGNDTVLPDDGNDTVIPDDGNDTVLPDDGNDTVIPDDGNDTVVPDDGNDTVIPDDGNDTVLPDDGNDTIPNPPSFPDLNTTDPDDGNDTVLPDDENDTVLPDDENETTIPDNGENPDGNGEDLIDAIFSGHITLPQDFDGNATVGIWTSKEFWQTTSVDVDGNFSFDGQLPHHFFVEIRLDEKLSFFLDIDEDDNLVPVANFDVEHRFNGDSGFYEPDIAQIEANENIEVDLSQQLNSILFIDGSITLKSGFVPTDICESNDGTVVEFKSCEEQNLTSIGHRYIGFELWSEDKNLHRDIYGESDTDENRTVLNYSMPIYSGVYYIKINLYETIDGNEKFSGYFFDENGSLIPGKSVEYHEVDGKWRPDFSQLTAINLTEDTSIDLDILQKEESQLYVEGNLLLDYTLGEVCKIGDTIYLGKECRVEGTAVEFIGENYIHLELLGDGKAHRDIELIENNGSLYYRMPIGEDANGSEFIIKIGGEYYKNGVQNSFQYIYNPESGEFSGNPQYIETVNLDGETVWEINGSLYEKLQITEKVTVLDIDLSDRDSLFYSVSGEVSSSIKLGAVCESDDDQIEFHGEYCRAGFEQIAYNTMYLELRSDSGESYWTDIREGSYRFELDEAGIYSLSIEMNLWSGSEDETEWNRLDIKQIELTESSKSGVIDIDIDSILDNQPRFEGTILGSEDYDQVRLESFDTKTYKYLGSVEIKSDGEYKLSIKNSDTANLKLTLNGNGEHRVFYLKPTENGIQLVSEQSIDWYPVDENGNTLPYESSDGIWVPDQNATGLFDFSGDENLKNVDIDLTELLGSFENSKLAVKGNIIAPEDYTIRVTVNSYENGQWVAGEDDLESGEFTVELKDSGKYILRFDYENSEDYSYGSYYYNPQSGEFISDEAVDWVQVENGFWMADPEKTGHFELNDENRSIFVDFDLQSEVFDKLVKISGNFSAGSNTINYPHIEAFDSENGEVLGSTKIQPNGKYSLKMPRATGGESAIFYISGEIDGSWGGFYISGLGTDEVKLINERDVEWGYYDKDGEEITDWGSFDWNDFGYSLPKLENYQPLGITSGEQSYDIDFETLLSDFRADVYKISGTITLERDISELRWNRDVSIEVFSVDEMKPVRYFSLNYDTSEVSGTSSDYTIDLPKAGNYVVRIENSLSDDVFFAYLNESGEVTFKSGDVDWKEGNNGNWIPDSSESGTVELTEDSRQLTLDIDFESIRNSSIRVSGVIAVNENFIVGEQCQIDGVDSYNDQCWENYNSVWKGWRSIRVTAIDTANGQPISSIELEDSNVTDGVRLYPFSVKVGETGENREIQLQIKRDSSTDRGGKYDEFFYNFGNSEVVDGKRIPYGSNGSKDVSETGSLDITTEATDLTIDLTSVNSNLYSLSGELIFSESGVELNSGDIEIIDAKTGYWIDSTPVEDNGSFEITLGLENEKYILKLFIESEKDGEVSHRELYLDFGDTHSTSDLTIIPDHKVSWIEKPVVNEGWSNWIPDVNPIELTGDKEKKENIELPTLFGYKLSGTVQLPTDTAVKYPSIEITELSSGDQYYQELQRDGSYLIENLESGSYTVEVMFQSEDGRYFGIFVNPDGTLVDGDSIDWEFNEDTNESIPDPDSVTAHTVNSTTTLDIDLSSYATTNIYNLTLNVNGFDGDIYSSLFVPRTSNYYWKYGSTPLVFEDIENRSGYYLNVWADGMEFYYNSSTEEFEKGVKWLAYDKSGSKVCPIDEANTDWNCNWNESFKWTWRPNIPSYDLSGMATDEQLTLSLPAQHNIEMKLNFGEKYANTTLYVDVYDAIDWGVFKWDEVTLNSSGEADVNISVPDGSNYRVAYYLESDWSNFVVSKTDSGSYEMILGRNSWNRSDWTPKASTLLTIESSLTLDFSSNGLPTLNDITINLDGLSEEEYVWVALDGGDLGYYGKSNYYWNSDTESGEYRSSLKLSVPAGDYNLNLSAESRKSGWAITENGDGNFTEFSWDTTSPVTVAVSNSDRTLSVTLPSNDNLREVSGTITVNSGSAEGWIEISNDSGSVGSMVSSDGNFTVKGVADGDSYSYSYTSWTGVEINGDIGTVSGNVTNLAVVQSSTTFRIYGAITGADKAVLINRSGSEWKVSDTADLNSSGEYLFDGLSDGIDYLIGAGSESLDTSTGVMSLTINNSTDSSGTASLSGVTSSDTITVTYNKEEE